MINWSQMKTAEQIAAEQASARRIAISRRQGLFYLVDTYGIKEADIEAQIAARAAAKAAKNWAEADRIRKELLDQGIVLKDSAAGTTWEAAAKG